MRFGDHVLPFTSASGTAYIAETLSASQQLADIAVRLGIAIVSGLATTALYNLAKWAVRKIGRKP